MTKITYLHELIAEEEALLIAAATAEREAEDAAWAALTPEERQAIIDARDARYAALDAASDEEDEEEEDDWYGDDEEGED